MLNHNPDMNVSIDMEGETFEFEGHDLTGGDVVNHLVLPHGGDITLPQAIRLLDYIKARIDSAAENQANHHGEPYMSLFTAGCSVRDAKRNLDSVKEKL